MKLHLKNGRIVGPDGVEMSGSILVQDGRIEAVEPEGVLDGVDAKVLDMGRDWVLPGLIDLHNDGLEKEIEPRPFTSFSLESSLRSFENRVLTSGITSIFHAIPFMGARNIIPDVASAHDAMDTIRNFDSTASVRHFVHARYEIPEVEYADVVVNLMESGHIRMVSLMDHTPGQGQFRDEERYRRDSQKIRNLSAEEVDEYISRRKAKSAGTDVADKAEWVTSVARSLNLPVASHDDDTVSKIDRMLEWGVSISEFPIALDVAGYAASRGMDVIVGAPNIVQGRSNTGNMRAEDAFTEESANILCSDYFGPALLDAAFLLYSKGLCPIHDALRTVTLNPARAAGIDGELGSIEPGKKADLLRVSDSGNLLQVRTVWVDGCEVFMKSERPRTGTNRVRREDYASADQLHG